jgi:hypothetical protein
VEKLVGAKERVCHSFVVEEECPSSITVGADERERSSRRMVLHQSSEIDAFAGERFSQELSKKVSGQLADERY